MSSNRLIYDSCAYQKELQQSTSPLDYALYTGKFENTAKCRVEFGVVGGNGVSQFSGNLVDLESDLRGQTRAMTLCPCKKYSPSGKSDCDNKGRGLPYSSNDCKKSMVHQPSCQMQYYPKVPMPVKGNPSSCDYNQFH
tara:strand:- start:174 stop:587 length:414 start_codon:yes stop_codon:yes gene_type:complete